MSPTIFVIDDDPAVRSAVVRRLLGRKCRVCGFASEQEAIDGLEHEEPDVVLLDLKIQTGSSLEVLRAIRQVRPRVLVIVTAACGAVEAAVEAMRLGAHDFIEKSDDLHRVEQAVARAVELVRLCRRLKDQLECDDKRFCLTNLIAFSPPMRRLVAQVQSLVRNAPLTVLLQGEAGIGKEFLARVLHHNGPRAAGPFVPVTGKTIPRDLFERELFGYERGAFTGANRRKRGLVEMAEGGTLFFDEIGDLDHAMQAKLVRVLQDRAFFCAGAAQSMELNCTVIAATNRDLKEEVARGAFREDLYFRLKMAQLKMPPLRARFEDILPLCRQAMLRYGREFGKEVSEIDAEAEALLQCYGYPGNVRELHNIIERAVIFCQGRRLTAGYLPGELRQAINIVMHATGEGGEQVIKVEAPLEHVSLKKIGQAVACVTLHLTDYNKDIAAKYLGISRYVLDRRLKGSPNVPGKAFSRLGRRFNHLPSVLPLFDGPLAILLELIKSCYELQARLIG